MFLPLALLLARISAFFAVLPIFSWRAVPVRLRMGMALLVTVFFATITPRPPATDGPVAPIAAVVLIVCEVLCGLSLGLAASLVYRAVQVGARFAGRQMGFAIASIVDPVTGEQGQPLAMVFETGFMMLFLAAGGHHLLLLAVSRSLETFPTGVTPEAAFLVSAVVRAGSAMLLFAMKLAAPILAATLILSLILAVISRILPEMNILLMSFPLRVGLGLFVAAATMPLLHSFAVELADWMNRFLVS